MPPKKARKVRKVGGDDEVPGCSKSVTYMNNGGGGGGGRKGRSAAKKSSTFEGKGGDESFALKKIKRGRGDDDDGGDGVPGVLNWPKNSVHPLLIPDVVRKIIRELGMADVDKVRQICGLWNDESCVVLRAKKIVALFDIHSMNYYLKKLGRTTDFPHHNFELHMENLIEPEIMLRFWNIFGSHVKMLDLQQSTLYIETLFDIVAKHLPNLERLAIKSLPRVVSSIRNRLEFGDPQEGNIYQIFAPLPDHPRADWATLRFPHIRELTLSWYNQDEAATLHILQALLRSMPSLQRLILDSDDMPSMVPFMARLLVQVLTDPDIPLLSLSTLEVPIYVGNDELTKLTEKKYPFETLNLNLQKKTESSSLKQFLISISPTLEHLEVEFGDEFFKTGAMFPEYSTMTPFDRVDHLRHVEDLTLTNFHGSLNFVKNLRILKRLTINRSKLDQPCFGFGEIVVNLEVFQTDSKIAPDDIISLSASFPLLRTLKLFEIDDVDMGVIYRNLPYIRELEIIKGKITDQGISGVPLEVCKDLTETSDFLSVDHAKFRDDLFLGSLQNLKTLKLACDQVTDAAIAFGIAECKNLESLTLYSPLISDAGLLKMADTMPQLKYLDIHQCRNVSSDGRFYVKEVLRHVPTLILDYNSKLNLRLGENPFRQVGRPHGGNRVGNGRLPATPGRPTAAMHLPPLAHLPYDRRMLMMDSDTDSDEDNAFVHRMIFGPVQNNIGPDLSSDDD